MGTSDLAQAALDHARRAWVRAGEAFLMNPNDPDRIRDEREARRAYEAALRDLAPRDTAAGLRSA
jgi:hypothetical protein